MAYNTWKGDAALGDVINQDDIDTLIDWDDNKITFKTDDTARLVIDNDHVSGSGALEVVGAATVGGNLFVSGSMSMGHGLAGDGALDIKLQNGNPQIIARYSTTHKTSLLTTSNGKFRIAPTGRTLEIDTVDTNGGNIHFTKNAAGTVAGGIAWNTSNEDVTLYSEEDLHLGGGGLSESMFTLDSTGKVGIGVDPTHLLTVAGAISGSSTLHNVGASTFGSTIASTGSITAAGAVSGSGAGSFGSLVLDGAANLQSAGITNAGPIAGATTIGASGNITTTGGFVSGSGYVAGLRLVIGNQSVIDKQRNAIISSYSGSGIFQSVGSTTLGSTLVVSGNVGATPSLGLGTSTVHASENNYLSIANGTEPSFATADQISIGSKDSTGYGSGNGATFSMNTEGLIENSPLGNISVLTHRVSVWINGTEYFIYLDPA